MISGHLRLVRFSDRTHHRKLGFRQIHPPLLCRGTERLYQSHLFERRSCRSTFQHVRVFFQKRPDFQPFQANHQHGRESCLDASSGLKVLCLFLYLRLSQLKKNLLGGFRRKSGRDKKCCKFHFFQVELKNLNSSSLYTGGGCKQNRLKCRLERKISCSELSTTVTEPLLKLELL